MFTTKYLFSHEPEVKYDDTEFFQDLFFAFSNLQNNDDKINFLRVCNQLTFKIEGINEEVFLNTIHECVRQLICE